MSQLLSTLGRLISVLSLTTIAFAGLFAWQFLRDSYEGSDQAINPNDNVCPYYPTPQKIAAFRAHEEFRTLFAKLDAYVASQVDHDVRPSVVANLVYLDEIVWSSYSGRVNKHTQQKPDENTIYRIASISKVFPVLFLYKLWENGLLTLEDDVTKYAPNFSIGRPYGSLTPIKLIDIASQLSGLPGLMPFNPITHSATIWNGTLEESLKVLRSEILLAEPRTKCYYSDLAFALLGHVLARNFTKDGNFTSWAQVHIVNALKLKNTGFSFTDDVKSRMATGYLPNGSEAIVYDILWYAPAGNYYSSIGDLAKLSMSFLETSTTILKHETLVEMLRPRKTCRHGYYVNYTGSPWEMNKLHSNLVITKHGDIDGYSAVMAMVPDLKLSFNALMSGTSKEDMANVALNEIIPVFQEFLRKQEQIINPTPLPGKYVGLFSYYGLQGRNITTDRNGVLYMKDPNAPPDRYESAGLSYISGDTFSLVIMGGEFPCVYKSVVNLEERNGALVHFNNMTEGRYNQFDIPELYVYGFKRQM